MSQKSLRSELNHHVGIAQTSIKDALQKLHDDTGLIPISVDFDAIDVRTFEQHEKEKAILIASVDIRANT